MKVIAKDGDSKMIEYQEGRNVKRVVLPADVDDIEFGIPYGLPFSLLLQQNGTSKDDADRMEYKLHSADIWTEQDLQQHPELIKLLDIDLNQLLQVDMPDLEQLDWSDVQNTLDDLLQKKGIYTINDIQTKQQDFMWCIKTALTKPLMNLYRANE